MRWIALLFVLVIGTAFSQEYAPSKAQTQAGATKSTNQKIGTDSRPLIVSVIPTEEDKQEAASREQERKDKAKSDAALVIWTGDLVTWTRVLAWLAAFQFLALILQAAIFAYQSKRLKETVELGRDEFNATHRPRIRIKHLWLDGDIFTVDKITVSLIVVNHGDMSARYIRGEVTAAVVQNGHLLPAKPFFAGVMVFTTTVEELPSGITLEFAKLIAHDKLSTADWISLRNGKSSLYCYGYVDYLDAANRLRRTTFCRVLRPTDPNARLSSENARFAKLDPEDKDYEYQD
jgi:hypothetical protein